jgi:hypothetical protein
MIAGMKFMWCREPLWPVAAEFMIEAEEHHREGEDKNPCILLLVSMKPGEGV